MKTIKTLTVVFGMSLVSSLMPAEAKTINVSNRLIDAIMIVESEKDRYAVGDGGKAIGMAQIHKICVDDVNRIIGEKKYTYDDRKSPAKSRQMMRIYLSYYGARYERLTKQKATPEILAKIWNGGPNGWKKYATVAYAKKVMKRMFA